MEPRTVSLSQLSDVGQYDESLSLSPPPALPLVPDDDGNNENTLHTCMYARLLWQ